MKQMICLECRMLSVKNITFSFFSLWCPNPWKGGGAVDLFFFSQKSGLNASLNNLCSSEGQSSILGKEMPELGDFPTCDQFEITILDGQPCYSLDVSKKVEGPTKLGKNHGLLLLLDPFPYQLMEVMEGKMDGQSFKVYMTHSQMLGKFEYTRGPIFKVVLEC